MKISQDIPSCMWFYALVYPSNIIWNKNENISKYYSMDFHLFLKQEIKLPNTCIKDLVLQNASKILHFIILTTSYHFLIFLLFC